MSDEDLKAELERLKAENEALKKRRSNSVLMKVSEKGAVSVYGLGRFPVTLYQEQWNRFSPWQTKSNRASRIERMQQKGLAWCQIVYAHSGGLPHKLSNGFCYLRPRASRSAAADHRAPAFCRGSSRPADAHASE